MENNEREKNKPQATFSANGIQALVWQNEGQNGAYYTVTIQRRYRKADGNWKTTRTFRMSDLPFLTQIIDRAFAEFGVKTREQRGEASEALEEAPF